MLGPHKITIISNLLLYKLAHDCKILSTSVNAVCKTRACAISSTLILLTYSAH